MVKEKKAINRKGIKFQIQSKISLSIMLVMAIVLVLVITVFYNLLIDFNNTEIKQDSEAVALQVEKYFAPFKRMVEQQALDNDVIEILSSISSGQHLSESPLYDEVLNKMIELKDLDIDNIKTVWIADIDSNSLITSAGYISGSDYDVTARAWFYCTETKETILTPVYVSASLGKNILSAVAPVFDNNGNVTGVFGIDVVLDTIVGMMGNYTIGENGYVMLMSSEGTFIYHPNTDLIDTMIQDMNITNNVSKAIEAQTAQFLKYTVDKETKYGYIMPIADTGFIALSCVPFGQYYSNLILAIVMLIFVLGGGIIFIIIIISKLAGRIVKPLIELNENAMQLAAGNLNVTINAISEDEVGDLGRSINKTVTRLKEYINYIDEISKVLTDMANGELTINLKYDYVGEFEKVKNALNHIFASMSDVMTNIIQSSNQVSLGSDDLAKAAQGIAESCENQAAAVEELLSKAATVADQVKENKNDAEKSAIYTKEVADMMKASRKQMAGMREAMNKIQESSNKVVGIVKSIEDIAEQTNLLSLNASIEAARAGEAGKGFAVVAGEISSLANQSGSAVNTTRDLIEMSLSEINKGNMIVNEVVEFLDQAVERVIVANEMIQNSAKTAEVQMHSVNQILDGVGEISQNIQGNSAMAEETSATSEELAAQSVVLNGLVQKFDLK